MSTRSNLGAEQIRIYFVDGLLVENSDFVLFNGNHIQIIISDVTKHRSHMRNKLFLASICNFGKYVHFDGLVQERHNSIANAQELRLFH